MLAVAVSMDESCLVVEVSPVRVEMEWQDALAKSIYARSCPRSGHITVEARRWNWNVHDVCEYGGLDGQ